VVVSITAIVVIYLHVC